MSRYALIKDGVVENVCEWDGNTQTWSPPAGVTAVQTDTAGPGWTYSGGVFSPPATPAKYFNGTTLDFLRLFTASEIITWNAKKREVAALTVADYADPAKAALVALEYQETMFAETNTIDTSRADLQAGLDVLIANGIIASGRKAEIIAGEAP